MNTTGFSKKVYAYSTDIQQFNNNRTLKRKNNTDTMLFVPEFNITINNNEN